MVDFDKVRIGEIGSVITGRTPKTSVADNFGNDFMFLGPSDLHKHFIITSSEKMITDKGLASIKSATIDGVSICTGCIGWDMGNVALVKGRCATNQQINSITNIKNDYNPYYIYYWLKGKKDFLFQQASVTRTPILNKTDFSSIEISVPNKNRQDKVANFLTAIDEKIELNNKINAELEVMAKLIYDYWFVQFDFPDANGKPYKSSGGKMVYNEALKREIPDGWVGSTVGDILESELGGTPSTKVKKYWGGDIPWLNSGEIANFPIIEAEEHITASAIDNSATSLMPKGTVVLSITRHLRPSILAVDACANQSVVGIYESEKLKASYLYPYLKNEIPRLMSLRTGAQQPHINKGIVDASPIILPSNEVLKSYYKKVTSIYEQLYNNAIQNKELTVLRDWLLPMLMNGQVTVEST